MALSAGKFKEWWGALSSLHQMAIAVTACLLLALALFLFFSGIKTDYSVLYHGLEPEDAGAVVEFLKQQNLPYRLGPGAGTISVAQSNIYDIRLQLATQNLPKNKIVGFEIFDHNNLGATEFVQQLNYTRALQGELSRTISHLRQVERAVVHIARPKPSIFHRRSRAATASVVLHVKANYRLTPRQIRGIAYLVASAVEGLDSESVTILDQYGRLLSGRHGQKNEFELGPGWEAQKSSESYLQSKAQSMLDQVLGTNKSVVRINLAMDFSKSKQTQELYNPENQTVQSETVRNHKREETLPQGGTGSRSKIAGQNTLFKQRQEREETRDIRYALDKTVKETLYQEGKITRLSLALVVDQSLLPQIQDIGKLVKESVGFDSRRGDSFEIAAIAFPKSAIPETAAGDFWQDSYKWMPLLLKQGGMVVAVIILGLILLVLLLKGKTPQAPPEATATPAAAPVSAEQEEFGLVVESVRQYSQKDVEGTATILRQWLHEEQKWPKS